MGFKIQRISIYFLYAVGALFVWSFLFWYFFGFRPSIETKKTGVEVDSFSENIRAEEDIEAMLPPVLEQGLEYRILSIQNQGEYLALEIITGDETVLFVPSDAKIEGGDVRVGSVLRAKRHSIFANGVLVFEAEIEN